MAQNMSPTFHLLKQLYKAKRKSLYGVSACLGETTQVKQITQQIAPKMEVRLKKLIFTTENPRITSSAL